MIESHLPLAKSVARRYAGRGVELDDLVQVAAVGLVKAADRFDVRRGVSFSTFAEPTIEGELRHHLRDRSGSVRIPRELQRLGKRLRTRQSELAARLGRAPTLSELADAVDADTQQVQRALAAEQAREPVSLPATEEGATAAEPYADSEDRLLLTAPMHVLDDRERRIVLLRFHADKTEREIAREVGISQAHVSRLLAGALTKLRAELAESETPVTAADITPETVVSPAAMAQNKPASAHRQGRRKRQAGRQVRRGIQRPFPGAHVRRSASATRPGRRAEAGEPQPLCHRRTRRDRHRRGSSRARDAIRPQPPIRHPARRPPPQTQTRRATRDAPCAWCWPPTWWSSCWPRSSRSCCW